MDTQQIRNAYMGRDVTMLDQPFGAFAEIYLGVKDSLLRHMFNLNEACNYIIACGYNNAPRDLDLPKINADLQCDCGDKQECGDPWEPDCGLGKSAAHAQVVRP